MWQSGGCVIPNGPSGWFSKANWGSKTTTHSIPVRTMSKDRWDGILNAVREYTPFTVNPIDIDASDDEAQDALDA